MISLLAAELALLSVGSKAPLVVKARSLIRGFCASNCTTTVKSAIRLPANDCLERDIAELQSKNLETWAKGCCGCKKRPEGIRG